MPAILDDISAEILDLKKKIGATILAHYYQEGEIQALADITGDSLKLAREATKVNSPVIVFCGVLFMAETAKMLNPAKKVLLPDLQAGCSLVDACPADKLERYQERLRLNGHKFQTVCYINSSAKVKALSDWVVTSGNAEDVVRNKVPQGYEILFVPDKHLGAYLKEKTGRDMILWDGSCMVHEIFSLTDLLKMQKEHPGAQTIAHPECPANILAHANFVRRHGRQ
ncbi:MAG: quinolinate synthase [Gemmataceae bacterium]